MQSLKGFATAFSNIEKELESAVKDKDFDADATPTLLSPPAGEPGTAEGGAAAISAGEPAAAPDAPAVGDHQTASARLAAALAQCAKLETKLAEKTELCAEKDEQIAAVMEEGVQLSKRQAEQEKSIRALRQSTREAQSASEKSAAELAEARAALDRMSLLHSEQANATAGQHGVALSEAVTRAAALEAEREAERAELRTLRARVASLGEELQALGLANATAEAREAVAVDALREVQLENSRLLEAGRWRDEGITSQLGELSARTDAAEAHATQLASAVASATKPLLRQLASAQTQQAAMQQAAAATEANLREKLASAEAVAEQAAARTSEAHAGDAAACGFVCHPPSMFLSLPLSLCRPLYMFLPLPLSPFL